MTQREKFEAAIRAQQGKHGMLGDLINAQLIGHGGKMPMRLTENIDSAIAHCEHEFLADPEAVVKT